LKSTQKTKRKAKPKQILLQFFGAKRSAKKSEQENEKTKQNWIGFFSYT